MSNDSNFASRLNAKVYGQATTPPKQISMEDIAKCRGSSQSIPALMLNNLKFFFKTRGQVITDAKIREILENNGADKIDTISKLFLEAPKTISSENATPHAIKKDLKMAADLSEIFGKAANQIGLATEGTKGSEWQKASVKANKAHIILSARHEMERHEPLDLLRAAKFESAHGIKNEKGLKEFFIEYLNDERIIPKNEEELKKAYKSFITDMIKFSSQKKELFDVLEGYIKEKPQQNFRVSLALEQSGYMKVDPNISATKYANMSANDMLKPVIISSLREKMNDIVTESTDIVKAGKDLEALFADKDVAEPILANIAQKTLDYDMHHFISAVLDFRASSPEEQTSKAAVITERFLRKDAVEEINLTEGVKNTDPLDDIYNHVVKTYVRNVLIKFDKINEAFDEFEVKPFLDKR